MPGGGFVAAWETAVDPETRRVCYVQGESSAAQREPPADPGAVVNAFPPGWETLLDADSGGVVFRRLADSRRQRERPEGGDGDPPPAWECRVDPASGRVYYRNVAERRVQWQPPAALGESQSAPAAPRGWKRVFVPKTGLEVYRHIATGRTQEERPASEPPLPGGSSRGPPPDDFEDADGGDADAEGDALPEGWEELLDPDTGAVYYGNTETGETQWERPELEGSSGSLPSGWENIVDRAGNAYYFCWATGVSQKSRPTANQAVRAQANQDGQLSLTDGQLALAGGQLALPDGQLALPDGPVVAEDEGRESARSSWYESGGPDTSRSGESGEDLPEGWERVNDVRSGKHYYFHEATGRTEWTRPRAPTGEKRPTKAERRRKRTAGVEGEGDSGSEEDGEASPGKAGSELDADFLDEGALDVDLGFEKEEAAPPDDDSEALAIIPEGDESLASTSTADFAVTAAATQDPRHALTEHLLAAFHQGRPFACPGYRPTAAGEALRMGLLEHAATGILLWTDALDLSSLSPDEPYGVFYHYTSLRFFMRLYHRVALDLDLFLRLVEETSFGKGVYATRKDPHSCGSRDAAVAAKFAARDAEAGAGAGPPAAVRSESVAYCVPILLPSRFASQLLAEEGSPRLPGHEDVWLLRIDEVAEAVARQPAAVDAAQEAKLERFRKRAGHLEESLGADAVAAKTELAALLRDLGRGDEATGTFADALAAAAPAGEAAEGAAARRARRGLAEALMGSGRHAEAEPLLRKALQEEEASLGRAHQVTLRTALSLGFVLRQLGNLQEAESVHRAAVKGATATLGAGHPDTIAAMGNFVEVLKASARFDEAEALSRRAFEGARKSRGPKHPDTLIACNNLASMLKTIGKYDEAEALGRQNLKDADEILGPLHSYTRIFAANLLRVLEDSGKLQDAEALMRRDLEACEQLHGAKSSESIGALTRLAGLLWALGRVPEAGTLFQRALKDSEQVLGCEHPDTLVAMGNLAEVMRKSGRYDEALSLSRRCLQGSVSSLGPSHPDTQVAMKNLEALMTDMGRAQENLPPKLTLQTKKTLAKRPMRPPRKEPAKTDAAGAQPQQAAVQSQPPPPPPPKQEGVAAAT